LAQVQDINGNQLSDHAAILTRWKEHFSELLNHPVLQSQKAKVDLRWYARHMAAILQNL